MEAFGNAVQSEMILNAATIATDLVPKTKQTFGQKMKTE